MGLRPPQNERAGMHKVVEDIADFIFLENPPQKADIIFIPGCAYPEVAEHAAQLWKQGFAPLVLPSGSHPKNKGVFGGAGGKKYPGPYPTEWALMQAVLLQNGVPKAAVLQEDKATFTLENAVFSKRVLEQRGQLPQRAIISCQPYHARRCFMYYQTAFPKTEFFICPVNTRGIVRENWHTTPAGIDLVLSELSKCGTQFADILKQSFLPGAGGA